MSTICGCTLSIVQFTGEKLGGADKTNYDAGLELLIKRSENTKAFTERIISTTTSVLQPNPSKLTFIVTASNHMQVNLSNLYSCKMSALRTFCSQSLSLANSRNRINWSHWVNAWLRLAPSLQININMVGYTAGTKLNENKICKAKFTTLCQQKYNHSDRTHIEQSW